jgi:hypothetical protein
VLCLSDRDHQIFNLDIFSNGSFPPVGGQPPAGQAINFGTGLPAANKKLLDQRAEAQAEATALLRQRT